MTTPPRRNLLSDVAGLTVGHAQSPQAATGVTVILPDAPLVAAIDVRGGGPGTRESDALALTGSVDEIHALVLSGGSAFGLSAATAVQTYLAEQGRGFAVRSARIPIVPSAILFDMLNGGDKAWGRQPPFADLAWQACHAATADFPLGSVGAGFGATTATTRGGLGSASAVLTDGTTVAALAAVNPAGSVTIGATNHFWAFPFERAGEFGGRGAPPAWPDPDQPPPLKGDPIAATTLAVVATDARLDKRQAHRLAVMAHTGLARAIYPVHTPLDGDVVFAVATGRKPLSDPLLGLARLGAAAADVLARAIARGVYLAAPTPDFWTGPPAFMTRVGGGAT